MLNTYFNTIKCWHNQTLISTYTTDFYIGEEKKEPQIVYLNWDNLQDFYTKCGLWVPFNVWNLNKGRMVCFFNPKFFNKDYKDIKEWKERLNITIKTEQKETSVSISEILKYHNSELAIKYLLERI
jgi:hypothetical protein